jgi:hypothetical protein
MNIGHIYRAALALGHHEPISIEPSGHIWTGIETDRYDLTDAENAAVHAKAAELETENEARRETIMGKLGLTADDLRILLS